MKLSYKQRNDLRSLLDPNGHIRDRGVTNSTLSALERRGLVKIERVQHEDFADVKVFIWKITDAGRVALAVTSTDRCGEQK